MILGLAVEIRVNESAIDERLRHGYAVFDHPRGDEVEPLRARATRRGEDFLIEVDGCPPREASDLTTAIRTLNHETLHGVMLRRRDCFYVHGACVAVDGRVIVLPGLSRAGKSTLALALIDAGADFLSDELFVYDPESHRVLAFPRAPKIRDACLAYFPRLEGLWVGDGEARFLPPAAYRNEETTGLPMLGSAEAPVAAVFAPQWDGTRETELRSKSTGEGLLDLARSAMNFGSHQALSIDLMARAIEGASCHDLRWREPHEAAAIILEAI